MKLRLNCILRNAVLAAMAAVTATAYADTTLISDGINKDDVSKSERFYDTGKGYYFSWYQYNNYWHDLKDLRNDKGSFAFLGDVYERMPSKTTTTNHDSLTNDANTCWAQVSMNMVEYWHSYYGVFCNDSRELTYGLCYDKKYLDETGGTLSLKQNLVFLDTFSNDGDSLWSYLDWFMLGDDDPWFAQITTKNQGGYWTDYFTTSYSTRNWYAISDKNLNDIDDLTTALLTTLGYVKNTDGTYTQRIKGQIVYLGMDATAGGGGHGITCHGVELDENGKVKAVYVTNSDDLEYKLFKLYLKADSTRLLLYTNEKCTELWEYSNANWYIDSVGGIRTPELLQDMLAEYEDADNALVWTGNTAANGEWDPAAGYTSAYLPDETTGWHIEVDGDFYAAFYDAERIIRFDDSAKSGKVSVTNTGTAHRMELNNKTLDYSFTGTGSNTLTVDTLVAANGGTTSFQQLQLTTTEALINNHTISLGNGAKWMGQAQVAAKGKVELAGGTLALTQLTLNGGSLSVTANSTITGGTIASGSAASLIFTPTASGTAPMLTIGSGVSFSGSALDIAMSGSNLTLDSTYALIRFETTTGNWASLFTTEQGELTYANNILNLLYNPVPKLSWSAASGTWSSTQWGNSATTTNDLRAEFTGSGTRTVSISGTVSPYSVKVDNSGAITFTGSGSISGSAGLTKTGSGSLTINNANSFTGGSSISGGTVNLGHAQALGTGTITATDCTLNFNGASISNSLNIVGDTRITNGQAYSGALVLEEGALTGGSLRLSKNATVQSGSISNELLGSAKITKTGSDTVTLSGANSYSGGTTINGGTLVAGNTKALGSGAVTMTGGTLNMSGMALSNAITATGGNTALTNAGSYKGALKLTGGTLTVEGGDASSGSLTLSGGTLMLDNSGVRQGDTLMDVNGTLTISAATKLGFTGAYTLGTHVLFDFGTLEGSVSNLTMIPQNGIAPEYSIYVKGNSVILDIKVAGAMLLWQGSAGTWCENGGSWQPGKGFKQGDQVLFNQGGKITLQGTLAPGVMTVDIAKALTFKSDKKLGGKLTGGAALTKKGTATLTLNADNPDWTGNIYLQAGTLTASGNTSFGTGDIYASGGTLNLASKAIANDIYITDKGVVSIIGGKKYTGNIDVDGSLATKTSICLAEGASLTLRSGKHSATVSGKGTMRVQDGNVTLQTGKYTMSELEIDSKLIVQKISLALPKSDSHIRINNGGSLTSAGKVSACHLTLHGGSVSMRNASPTALTLTGNFTADDNATVQLYGAFKSNTFTLNGAYFRLLGDKAQTITVGQEMSLSGGRGLITNGKITAGWLSIDSTKLTLDSAKAASLTLKSKTAESSLRKATVSINGSVSSAGMLRLTEGSSLTTTGKVSAATLTMEDAILTISNAKPQSLALTGKTDAMKMPLTSTITDSDILLNGSMSVAANLVLNNSTLRLRDANTAKPKALGLSVKGNLTIDGDTQVFLTGALSAKNMMLNSGSLTLAATKLTTTKVSGILGIFGETHLDLAFNVTQKDLDKGKAYTLFSFKEFEGSLDNLTLGYTGDYTLAFNAKGNAITLTIDDAEAWNQYAADVLSKPEFADAAPAEAEDASLADAKPDEVKEDAESLLLAPAVDAAEVEAALAKAADTLAQSTWGTVGASRAFAGSISARGTHATLLDDGKGAAWIATMGGTQRLSSDGGHAGADYTLTGAAFGMEALVSADSVLGLALGNSWGKVSPFSAYTVDQDSTHLGIYGSHKLNNTLTLSWMATHTRTESEASIAGMRGKWAQDTLQLDTRLTWGTQLTARTALNAFGGLQYLATDSGEFNGIRTGSVQNLRAEIGVGASHQLSDSTFAYGELSFVGDMVRHNPTVDLSGFRTHGANPGRMGLNLSVGASHSLNEDWSVNAAYHLELMHNSNSHSLNVGASYSF